MSDAIRPALAVILGVGLIIFGCQTDVVGDSDLHQFLIAMGIIMVLIGGLDLI